MDGHDHSTGEQQARADRDCHAAQQEQQRAHDRRVQRGEGFLERLIDKHPPARRVDQLMSCQHRAATHGGGYFQHRLGGA
ncbi:MAG TPA: hypothetical protein VFB50_19340 [Chloroflexota bacterium]|nr:hypothetical protein [Chloroflexota bacterium]